jgi:hypothetical protein
MPWAVNGWVATDAVEEPEVDAAADPPPSAGAVAWTVERGPALPARRSLNARLGGLAASPVSPPRRAGLGRPWTSGDSADAGDGCATVLTPDEDASAPAGDAVLRG